MPKATRYSRSGPCIITGCAKKRHASGLCRMHYARRERHGDPLHRDRIDRAAQCEPGINASPADGCVIVQFQDGKRPTLDHDGTCVNASRYVWIKANGDPGDQWVLHSCGNGIEGCINIHHLYLGDPKQNSADRRRHGTHIQGSQVHGSKLSETQVAEIRERYIPGRIDRGGNAVLLAQEYDVHYKTIWSICTDRGWSHI